jgi:hypothetical protein
MVDLAARTLTRLDTVNSDEGPWRVGNASGNPCRQHHERTPSRVYLPLRNLKLKNSPLRFVS